MIKSILLITLVLLIPLFIAHSIPSIYSNYSKPITISTVQIYKNLSYKIELEKQVTVNVTQTTFTNSTTKTNVVPTSKLVPTKEYVVNYSVLSVNGTELTVQINGNFSKNFTFISKGNFSENIFEDVISLDYPYILPFLLLNNTYALLNQKSVYVISFLKKTNYTINNVNLSANEFYVVYNSSYFGLYETLSNGLLANFTTTYNGSTLVMSLLNYSNEYNITLNSSFNAYLTKPYLYLNCIYNEPASNIQPNSYVETYYTIVAGNYLGQIVYLLYPQQGNIIMPNSFYGVNVNYELYFKPVGDEVLTYLPSNSSVITWNGRTFDYVNITTIKLINGSTTSALLYRNVSTNTTVYLYFSKYSNILLEEEIYSGLIHNYTVRLLYLGNEYVSFNATYPTLTSPKYTTLPYSLVNFNQALIVAIIITVIVSAIIILFRQR